MSLKSWRLVKTLPRKFDDLYQLYRYNFAANFKANFCKEKLLESINFLLENDFTDEFVKAKENHFNEYNSKASENIIKTIIQNEKNKWF